MKIKTPYTLAAIFAVSLFASGCSQMAAQTTGPEVKPTEQKTVVDTDCSKCNKQKPAPAVGGAHTHPAIPGCTNSTTHTHPFTNAKHQHAYSCKGAKPKQPKPPKQPKNKQKPLKGGKWDHTHPAIPGCTDSITHTHPYNNANHSHHYSCKGGPRQEKPIDMPQVKAKGNYKGPVQIDTGVMQTYKKQ
ncbi:MAG: hypothetical protein ACH34X_02740 [Thiolinea sp.]|jgi:transposase-like protein